MRVLRSFGAQLRRAIGTTEAARRSGVRIDALILFTGRSESDAPGQPKSLRNRRFCRVLGVVS